MANENTSAPDDTTGDTTPQGQPGDGTTTTSNAPPADGTPQATQPSGHHQQPPQQHGQPHAHPGGAQQSLTDIVTKPTTQAQLKQSLSVYAATGVGIGVAAYMLIGAFGGGGGFGGQLISGILGLTAIMSLGSAGPLLAGLVGWRTQTHLPDEPDNFVYATAATSAAIGHILLFFIGGFLVSSKVSSDSGLKLGELAVPTLVTAAVAGGVAIVAVYAADTFTTPSNQ